MYTYCTSLETGVHRVQARGVILSTDAAAGTAGHPLTYTKKGNK